MPQVFELGAVSGWMLAVGCREKIEKFVHNACLLNYYCYLYGKLRKKLRMLRHGASQGNPKGLPCCHFIKLPSTKNGLTLPLSYIHTSFIAFGDCLCRAMICLRIKTPVFAVFYALRKLLQIREFLRLYLSINKELIKCWTACLDGHRHSPWHSPHDSHAHIVAFQPKWKRNWCHRN